MPPTIAQPLDYATPPRPPKRVRRIGVLSLAASMFLPGLGQFIAGRQRRAVLWLCTAVCCNLMAGAALCWPASVPVVLVLAPLSVVITSVVWVDAFRCGHRAEAPRIGRPAVKYPLFILLLAAALFASPNHVLAWTVRYFLVEAFAASSQSMNPTLTPGDWFLAHKPLEPKRWDVIVFDSPHSPGTKYVSRLVGLPGETVEIVGGVVHANGTPHPSPPGVGPYSSVDRFLRPIRSNLGPTGTQGDPIKLGPDEYYVLGDNSPVSLDSRYWARCCRPPTRHDATLGDRRCRHLGVLASGALAETHARLI